MRVEGGNTLRGYLARLRAEKNVPRAEIAEMVGRIHLNTSGLPGCRWFESTQDNSEILVKFYEELARIAKRRGDRPFEDGTLNFIASFPRSGNTLTLQSLAKLGGVQIFTDEIHTPRFMPYTYFPADYPLKRVVKSHRVVDYDPGCRYVYVVRDGRDLLPSIAYMSRRQVSAGSPVPRRGGFFSGMFKRGVRGVLGKKGHLFTKRGELADFMLWLRDDYKYGDWIAFHRKLATLRERENVLIVKYPDLVRDDAAIRRIADFLAIEYTEESVRSAFATKDDILEKLAGSNANEKWGLGEEFEEGSLFHAWSKNRSGTNWRDTMDARAKQTFHELGATELLVTFGFEDNPEWWR